MSKIDPDAPAKIDAAIAAAPPFARPVMERLRTLIRQADPSLVEDWKWKTPCYATPAGLVCGFNAFKAHVSLHFFKGGLIDSPDAALFEPPSTDATSRNLKFTAVADIKPAALKRLVKAASKLEAAGTKPKKKTKRDLAVPPALSAELAKKKHAKAKAFWDAISYSAQREFVVWLDDAKRDDTKTRRLQQTLDMLTRGERKNDKYRNC